MNKDRRLALAASLLLGFAGASGQAAEQEGRLAQGARLASATQAELGKNLMKALGEGGPTAAIEFCSSQALPITAAMAESQAAEIARISDRPRNPLNVATGHEVELIARFQAQLDEGATPQPVLEGEGGAVTYYAPIVTNAMCLQCHGIPDQNIASATLEALAERYPEDRATGYDANQVRGLWRIRWQD